MAPKNKGKKGKKQDDDFWYVRALHLVNALSALLMLDPGRMLGRLSQTTMSLLQRMRVLQPMPNLSQQQRIGSLHLRLSAETMAMQHPMRTRTSVV